MKLVNTRAKLNTETGVGVRHGGQEMPGINEFHIMARIFVFI